MDVDRLIPEPLGAAAMARILLVEDSDDLRVLLARVLEACGFEVCQAVDGREALELLAGFTPDAVVTDLRMPRLGGLDLVRRIRETPGLADVPVVMMSVVATEEAERAALAAGATDFFTKPFDHARLIARLRRG